MNNNSFSFRTTPVPYTGITHFVCYRRIRYIQAKRLAARDKDTGTVRSARNTNTLPEPFKLEPYRDFKNRGWKRQGKRRHQWE